MNKKGKRETGEKIAIYLTDNREILPFYKDLEKSVRKEHANRKTGKECDRRSIAKRKSSQHVYENISNLISDQINAR